jgi:hypothetical protein
MKFFESWEEAEKYANKYKLRFSVSNNMKGVVGTEKELSDFCISYRGMNWFHGKISDREA